MGNGSINTMLIVVDDGPNHSNQGYSGLGYGGLDYNSLNPKGPGPEALILGATTALWQSCRLAILW